MTPSTHLPSADELTDELIRYRLVMLPLAIEAVVASLEKSRAVAKEFIEDAESGRKVVDFLHEEATDLLRAAAISTSVEGLELHLQYHLEKREKRVALAKSRRRSEAEAATRDALRDLADLPQDDERVNRFRTLLESLPQIAEDAPDEVTLELLWDTKVRELGLECLFEEEG